VSSSESRPLLHVLYTNVRGEGREQGLRPIFDYFHGEEKERKEVVEWLKGLEINLEGRYGWAARGFSVGGTRHAALAVVNPHFGLDDLGSAAVLSHALLVPMPANQPSGNFFLALYQAAARFLPEQSEQVQSLPRYLEGCKTVRDLTVPELNPADLEAMADFLRELLVTVAHLQPGRSMYEMSLCGVRTEEELPEMLAKAGGSIPPRLRLAFRWATGVKPASGLVVVHGRPAGEAPPGIQGGPGEAYFEWLHQRLKQHDFDAIREIAEDSNIISWEKLRERIATPPMEEVEPVRQVLKGPEILEQEQERDPIPPKEKTTMKRPPRPKTTDSSSSGSLAEVRELLQNEFVRMEESLRDYLADRLSRMGDPRVIPAESGGEPGSRPEGGPRGMEPPAGRRGPGRAIRWFQAFRPEIYFFVVLLLLGGIYWKGFHRRPASTPSSPPSNAKQEGSGPASNQASPGAQANPDTDREGTSQGRQADDFVAQWREYLRTHQKETAQLLASLTDPQSPVKVGRQTQASLEAWSKKLERGQPLSGEESAKTATALFEYVHALWSVRERQGNLKDNVVSLSTDEVTPEHLKAILQAYSLDFGPAPGRDDPNVQAAVVLRWLGF